MSERLTPCEERHYGPSESDQEHNAVVLSNVQTLQVDNATLRKLLRDLVAEVEMAIEYPCGKAYDAAADWLEGKR